MSGQQRQFELPPYPYDRLTALADIAKNHDGGMVDLSVGTPCDPTPGFVVEALGSSGSERGYPQSTGSPALRTAASQWINRKFGVEIDSADLAACVGTKELVVSVPWYMHLRNPTRDTVISPAIAYPSYAMGANLAGLRSVTVPELAGGGIDFGAISEDDASRALLIWVNSPSNPTGTVSDLSEAADWVRQPGLPVLAAQSSPGFTWGDRRPERILQHGHHCVVAVHSLSKRSNMAGVRVGFYAGDAQIVRFLSEIRKHAGMMVPGPVQAAAVAALGDDVHVEEQRNRYLIRLGKLSAALKQQGMCVNDPAGGFYLWVRDNPPNQGRDPGLGVESGDGGWGLAERLAHLGGLLCSPGELFGERRGYVRIAAVQPDAVRQAK